MNSNGLDNGLANGRFDNSFVGFTNGLVGSEQIISEANTFIFTIRTTSTRTLDLPLVVGGTYNFWIDWGDGKKDYVITYNQANTTHTYPTALKNYTVKITGVCRGWSYFGLASEPPKLLSIERWGCLELIDDLVNGQQFAGCSNLDLSNVKDTLNTKYLTSMYIFFALDTNINVNLINNWDISKITNFQLMFNGCSIFNEFIGNWDTSNVTNMIQMFINATAFNQDINSWDVSKVVSMNSMFSAAIAFNQPLYNWNTSACTSMSSMFNNATAFNQDINNWDVSKVTTIDFMFNLAGSFNQPLSGWNTNSCTNMSFTFQNALQFNQNINSWNVGKVSNMSNMFNGASNFNQPLSGWNTSSATTMSNMFSAAGSFNQNIGNWNVSKVTNMNSMFASASLFNNGLAPGISGTLVWNTSACTSMFGMFQNASFNQNINSWDVSKVANMGSTFANATTFNQPLSGWNTSACTTMASMFSNAPVFNQNINNWNVSKVGDMTNMFLSATAFNQPLSGWNTSSATSMVNMFSSAPAFDQNIGNWNVSAVTSFSNFMNTKIPATFSTTNLDAIYNGWINNLLRVSLSISFGSAKRTAASTEGRALLTRANTSLTVTGAVNNGSGLIRITTSTVHGRTTGNKVFISAVTGAIQANGLWTVTVINTTQVDLQGSAFSSAYISGGAFRTGYGWTIVDGGI